MAPFAEMCSDLKMYGRYVTGEENEERNGAGSR